MTEDISQTRLASSPSSNLARNLHFRDGDRRRHSPLRSRDHTIRNVQPSVDRHWNGAILAAALSLLGVALAQADELGSLLLVTGIAILVAGLVGFDVVRQVHTRPISTDPE